MRKGFVFSLHSIAGLLSGIFILVLSITGSLLVFREEVDELFYPSISINQSTGFSTLNNSYNIIQKHLPHAQISHCLLTDHNRTPVIFTVYDSSYKNGTEALQVWTHPQTGTILEKKGASTRLMNRLAVLHTSFFLGKTGEWLLGAFAIIFIISIISGFYLYRKNILAVLSFNNSKTMGWKPIGWKKG